MLHLAITSTYLPFFFPLPAAPLRAWGAPSKSSIELALLKDVDGRGGGCKPAELPGGVGTAAPVETDRGPSGGGIPNAEGAGLPGIDGGGAPAEDPGRLLTLGGIAAGGTLAVLGVRLGGAGPRGGGGVPRTGALLLGSFLLTHFFKS